MKILITGASGKTGLAVIRALKNKDLKLTIRALVHRESRCNIVKENGADEAVIGDMLDPSDMYRAMKNIDAVYHICSTANEHEYEIGKVVYDSAQKAGVKRFVYHSVLHSIFSKLPHHNNKHKVEKMISEAELPYVILQPSALMQNLMISKEKIIRDGIFMQRFFEKDNVRMNLVDLDDVACIAADVLTDNRYDYGTYELCGPENLCESEIISAMENAFGKTVKSQFIPDDAFVEQMKKEGRSETYINTLLIMFRHYQNEGFMGNPTTLQFMLKRKPVTLEEFLKKEIGK